jgi:hypothetical protein
VLIAAGLVIGADALREPVAGRTTAWVTWPSAPPETRDRKQLRRPSPLLVHKSSCDERADPGPTGTRVSSFAVPSERAGVTVATPAMVIAELTGDYPAYSKIMRG